MEMEKNNNCSEKGCENCSKDNHMGHMGGCCHCKKCWIMKKILCIIVIIIAFTLGARYGEMRSYKYNNGNYGYKMMNWGGQRGYIQTNSNDGAQSSDVSNVVAPAPKQ